LGESDDEEDVGKIKQLNYGESDDEEKDNELINLDDESKSRDRTNTAAE
jgi:hypothetical protein